MASTHKLEVDGDIKLPLFCPLCVVRMYICVYTTQPAVSSASFFKTLKSF